MTGDLVADDNFNLGAFSNTTGFPGHVALHEQRLIFSNTSSQPRTLFFSKSGDFLNFTPGTADADPLTFTLGSDQANEVRYLQPGRFSASWHVRWRVYGYKLHRRPLTPTTTQILKQGTYGSARIQPITIGNAQRSLHSAQNARSESLCLIFQSDSYQAPEMTLWQSTSHLVD